MEQSLSRSIPSRIPPGQLKLRKNGEPGAPDDEEPLLPVIIAESNPIILVALDGTFDLDGNGDLDADGIDDIVEVSNEDPADDTDPCDDDSDDDGVLDGVDSCPNEGFATDEDLLAGIIVGSNGCKRQSQCSNGNDDDTDGLTDFPADVGSCTSAADDSEDSFDDADSDGVGDGNDSCPAEGPPNPALGELLDGTGCIFPSECSDGFDNADQNGLFDHVSVNGATPDPECSSITDDDESS